MTTSARVRTQLQQVLWRINIDGRIGHWNPETAVGMSRQDQACSRIAPQFREAGEGVRWEYGRHAGMAGVARCDQPVRLLTPCRGKPLQVEGSHSGLVRERDEHAIAARGQSGHTQAQGAGQTFLPVAVDQDRGRAMPEQGSQLLGMGPEDYRDCRSGHLGSLGHCPVQQWLTVNAHQLLGRTKAAGGTSGEHQNMQIGLWIHAGLSVCSGLACTGSRRPLEFAGFFLLNSNFGHNIE
jgi:hypothetical protein